MYFYDGEVSLIDGGSIRHNNKYPSCLVGFDGVWSLTPLSTIFQLYRGGVGFKNHPMQTNIYFFKYTAKPKDDVHLN
jgi:hypothetical protein